MEDKKVKMNWPRKGDKAFIGEITPHSPVHAYLDGLKYDTVDHISWSYKEAADAIVKSLESGGISLHPDIFFFPICYLYRHTIELELKGIVELGIKLDILPDDDKHKKLLGSHSLCRLWNKATVVLKKFYTGDSPEDLNAAGNLIQQFHALDKTGQSFRYCKTRTGERTLKDAPEIVDLANLREKFDGLYNFLTATQGGMEEALSNVDYC